MPSKQTSVSSSDLRFVLALGTLGTKPPDSASREIKKAYSERLSQRVAYAIASELRNRGMKESRPQSPGESEVSGAERRMAGGIGAKKVDVTWATEQAGLLAGFSVKSISFKDKATGNYQKNLTNRRGDMLFESVTLHRRFPYAVLIGLFLLDEGAKDDGTPKRASTFENAHNQFALFTGRVDPAAREEQYEKLYIALIGSAKGKPRFVMFEAGKPDLEVTLDRVLSDAVAMIARRNPDFYREQDERLVAVSRLVPRDGTKRPKTDLTEEDKDEYEDE